MHARLIFRANKFKNAHPELLLGTIDRRPKIVPGIGGLRPH